MDTMSFITLMLSMFLCGALVGMNVVDEMFVAIAASVLAVLIGYVGVYVNTTWRDR